MDEGAFDQNFTWYEWGFVNPSDVPANHSHRTQATDQEFRTAARDESRGYWEVHPFVEDRRWTT